jgi:uncharacterized membrane protein
MILRPKDRLMEDRRPTPSKPPFRWGRLVLFVSLALNLLVLGAALGRFGHERGEFVARDIGFGLFSDVLHEEDRRALRRAYKAANPDMRADRRQMRDDLQTLMLALRAEPFAPEALRAALESGAARAAQRQVLGQGLILDRVGAMTPAERAGLADRLERSLKRRSKGNAAHDSQD